MSGEPFMAILFSHSACLQPYMAESLRYVDMRPLLFYSVNTPVAGSSISPDTLEPFYAS